MLNKYMLIGIIAGIIIAGIGTVYAVCVNACGTDHTSMQSMMSGMMFGMGNAPQDVIIKVISSQQVSVGKMSQVELLILDKNTKNPIDNAQVIVGIERGAPMSTMDMMGTMFTAENIGNGKYVVRFTLEDTGYYTLHTHVIPAGKSMHSMMSNHMDIGIKVV